MKKVLTYIWKLLNTIYWLINKPFGIIVINSWIDQKWGHIISKNIGDDINYYLIKALSGKKVINYRNIIHKGITTYNILCIGSIVDWMTNSNSIIWGSGVMYGEENRMKNKPLKVCAVRGPLTRNYLLSRNISCPEIYGDPALLLPLIYKSDSKKKYKLGIIPHFYDYNSCLLSNIVSSSNINYTIINVSKYDDWKKIVDQICECEVIASSSLHGLILSDAYGIPNIWIQFSDKMKGGNFKFWDYMASVGRYVSNPLDLRNCETIDCDSIIALKNNYQKPIISLKPLLDACPFKIKSEYIQIAKGYS